MKVFISFLFATLLFASKSSSAQKASRLISESMYLFDGAKFNFSDSTKYNYISPKRGGDLNSKYISYGNAERFLYAPSLGIIQKNQLINQSFDIYNHRDLAVTTVYNTTFGAYENSSTVYYYTTVDDTFTSIVNQVWNKSLIAWQNTTQQIYTHDASGNRSSESLQYWDISSGTWINNEKFTYTFDASKNMTSRFYQTWNISTSSWENNFKDSNTYTVTNKPLESITEVWSAGAWKKLKKQTYNYDGADLMIESQELGWDATASNWYNFKKYTYAHDAAANVISFSNLNWNSGTGSWDEFRKRIYTYDAANNLLTNTWYYWNDTTLAYDNGSLETASYDASNNKLTETSALWDKPSNSWISNEKLSTTYNSYNQKTVEQNEVWDNTLGSWKFRTGEQKYYYYYEEYSTSITNPSLVNNSLKIYPTLAKEYINIKADLENTQSITINICDIQGRKLKQWAVENVNNYNYILPLQDFVSGQYFISIFSHNSLLLKTKFQVIK